MKSGWIAVLLMGCSGLLSACGIQLGPSPAKLVNPRKSDVISGAEGDRVKSSLEAARTASLKCPFPEECNPSVALVSVVTKEGVDRCSGVLISEDRILTNEHCVRGLADSCEEKVFVHFAETEGIPEQHAGCLKIESRSPEADAGGIGMDFAIIRLDRKLSGRKFAKPAIDSPRDHENMNIYRVQMQGAEGDPLDGAQERLRCDVARRTYSYPALDSGKFELMALADCAIQAGNSGAPILNGKGELVALLQGYLRLTDEESAQAEFRDHLLDESFGQTGIGTRISCIPGIHPGEEGVREGRCVKAPPRSGQSPREFLEKDDTAMIPPLPSASEDFSWLDIVEALSLEKHFVEAPRCRKSPRVRLRTLIYQKGINRELRAEWRRKWEDSGVERDFSADETSSGDRCFSSDGWAVELPACH